MCCFGRTWIFCFNENIGTECVNSRPPRWGACSTQLVHPCINVDPQYRLPASSLTVFQFVYLLGHSFRLIQLDWLLLTLVSNSWSTTVVKMVAEENTENGEFVLCDILQQAYLSSSAGDKSWLTIKSHFSSQAISGLSKRHFSFCDWCAHSFFCV